MSPEEIELAADKIVAHILQESIITVLDIHGHALLLHFTEHEMLGSARILSEERAMANPCQCFPYDGRDYCFAKGAIGMLTQDQQDHLCKAGKIMEVKPGLRQRFERFAEAAKEAHKKIEAVPKGERLVPWLESMSHELAQRGVEV